MSKVTAVLQALGLGETNAGAWAGSWSNETSGPLIESVNPATGSRLAHVRGATAADYERVLASAV